MTFVQKYIITPVVGAAGVTVGFAYLQKKYKFFDLLDFRGPAAMKADGTQSETTRSDLVHIAGQLNQLSLRLAQVETRQVTREKFEKEWTDRFNSGFKLLEQRMTDQNDQIRLIEGNYKRIEERLDVILTSLRPTDTESTAPNGEFAIGARMMSVA